MSVQSNTHTSGPGAALTARDLAEHRERVCDMPDTTCAIAGCDKPTFARDWCCAHWTRWRRHGDPLGAAAKRQPTSIADRIARLIALEPSSGCWLWVGSIDANGYGRIGLNKSSVAAHRVSYEQFVAPIPAGLDVDHQCHNADLSCSGGAACVHRRCVNPGHLRVVDRRTNTLAGRGVTADYARRTRCANGHEFTAENTYMWRTSRMCRKCNAEAQARVKARKQGGLS